MDAELTKFIESAIANGAYKLILSNPKGSEYKKITFSLLNGAFEIEKLTEKQAFHSRAALCNASGEIAALMENFRQLNAWSGERELSARYTSKGKLLTHENKLASAPQKRLLHDRAKEYALPDGVAVPALVDVGVMSADGHIVKAMADKYKQINRFLELIDDCLGELPKGSPFYAIDFGCGKSYLTFVLYHY